MQSQNDPIERNARVTRPATVSDNVRRQASLPLGFDLHHWQKARLMEQVIEAGQRNGKIAPDLSTCTMSQAEFHDHWYDVQDAVAFGILAGLALDPPFRHEFDVVLERYRKSGCDFHALVPAAQWLKDFAFWDYRVILFTLRQSIVLPNENARARQEAVAFAWRHATNYANQMRPSVRHVYMMYQYALAEENAIRTTRGVIPFSQLSHEKFRSLIKVQSCSDVIAARDGVSVASCYAKGSNSANA
jgi:hypothetical protein